MRWSVQSSMFLNTFRLILRLPSNTSDCFRPGSIAGKFRCHFLLGMLVAFEGLTTRKPKGSRLIWMSSWHLSGMKSPAPAVRQAPMSFVNRCPMSLLDAVVLCAISIMTFLFVRLRRAVVWIILLGNPTKPFFSIFFNGLRCHNRTVVHILN